MQYCLTLVQTSKKLVLSYMAKWGFIPPMVHISHKVIRQIYLNELKMAIHKPKPRIHQITVKF